VTEETVAKYDFAELTLIDKQRVYAENWGNAMLIATFVNNRNASIGSKYRVTFVDIQDQINKLSDEERVKLRDAYLLRMDAEAKSKILVEGGNYMLKLVEKLHPDYSRKSEVRNVDKVVVLLEHVDRAAKMCGYNKNELAEELGCRDVKEIEHEESGTRSK